MIENNKINTYMEIEREFKANNNNQNEKREKNMN